jgi:hypothetical protein
MLILDAYYFKGLPVLLKSDAGKKIYGKFMNIADETAQAWLQGVVDLVEILHIDIVMMRKRKILFWKLLLTCLIVL